MLEVSGKRITPLYFDIAKHLCIIFAILIIPLSLILPEKLSWENGFLENLQVFILSVGFLTSFIFYKQSYGDEIHSMWLTVSGLFLLLIGRELSWGRAFFQTKMTENRPEFISMDQLPYYLLMDIVIAFFVAVVGVGVLSTISWRKIFFEIPFPKAYITLVFIGTIFTIAGDHGWIFPKAQGETIEELGELLIYFLLNEINLYYHYYLKKRES